jgi:hypothetical protein
MSREIKITWQIEDGYAGQSRPQYCIITEYDIGMDWEEWDSLSDDDREEFIYNIVQDDFEEKVHYEITRQEDIK